MLRRPRMDLAHVRGGIRWFATELLVVAAGVLLALGAQTWWEGRQDRARERDYLERLLDDTRRNAQEAARMVAADSMYREKTRALMRILRDGDAMPDQDSLATLAQITNTMDAVLTTTVADALTASGDLRLLRDPAVRDSTLKLFNQVRDVMRTRERNADRIMSLVGRRAGAMLRHLRPTPRGTITDRERELDIVWWHRVDFDALRRDPEGIAPFQEHLFVRNNNLSATRSLRDRLAAYQRQLETALAAR